MTRSSCHFQCLARTPYYQMARTYAAGKAHRQESLPSAHAGGFVMVVEISVSHSNMGTRLQPMWQSACAIRCDCLKGWGCPNQPAADSAR
jgi:hypothetical protein